MKVPIFSLRREAILEFMAYRSKAAEAEDPGTIACQHGIGASGFDWKAIGWYKVIPSERSAIAEVRRFCTECCTQTCQNTLFFKTSRLSTRLKPVVIFN
ncbi:MAG: hypothetical protein KME16_02530 [Scytolyngbya sp. HA4215-MV1]|nr:hypothetical protein [Scytolyngbya sp. HA4215-MV1]